jgi:hypothetical protein
MTKRVKNIHEVLTELNTRTEDIRLRKEADQDFDHQAEVAGDAPDLQNDGS